MALYTCNNFPILAIVLGLLVLGLILQVMNHVRMMKLEKKIKEKVDDLCLRK